MLPMMIIGRVRMMVDQPCLLQIWIDDTVLRLHWTLHHTFVGLRSPINPASCNVCGTEILAENNPSLAEIIYRTPQPLRGSSGAFAVI